MLVRKHSSKETGLGALTSSPGDRTETVTVKGLADLRRSRGLTQVQLARRLHISQAAVSKIELAESATLRGLQRYLAGLDADLSLVVEFSDQSVELHL